MKIKTLMISALFALTSGTAIAGKTSERNVEIDMEARTAFGNMKTARYSENEAELIGCGTRTYSLADGSTFIWGFCQASLSDDEENAFCFTEEMNLINQINASSDYSFLTFGWDEEGSCTHVGQSTQSFYCGN